MVRFLKIVVPNLIIYEASKLECETGLAKIYML